MNILFRSAVSGMLYLDPDAAGTIDMVVIDGVEFTRPTNPLDRSDKEFIALSLALCARLRPGFAYAAREVASRLLGSEDKFDTCYNLNPNVQPQVPVTT